MTEHQTILRGKEAQMVLDSEAFKAAFSMLKEAIDEKRSTVSVRDQQGLVIAALWERIHRDYKSVLIGMVQNGDIAQRRVDIDKYRDEPKARTMLRKVMG